MTTSLQLGADGRLWATPVSERLYRFGWFWIVLLTLSLPWDLFQRIPFTPTTISKVGGGIIILTAAAIVVLRRKIPRTGLEWPILAFAIACAIATVISEDRAVSLAMFQRYAGHLVLFYGVFVCTRNASYAQTALTGYCVSAVGVAVVSILCKAGVLLPADWLPTAVPYSGRLIEVAASGASMRMTATSPDLNQGALLLLMAFALACHTPFSRSRLRVSLQVAAAVLLFTGIFITQSRSALLAGGLIAGFLPIRHLMHYPKRLRIAVLIVATTLMMLLTVAMYETIREWMFRSDQSASSRMTAYRAGLKAVPQHLAVGTGLDASDVVLSKTAEAEAISGQTIHSVPLKIVLETGLVGLLAYIWLWGQLGVRTWRGLIQTSDDHSRGMGAALLQLGFAIFCMQALQPVTALPHYPVMLGLWCAALPNPSVESNHGLAPQRYRFAYAAVAAAIIVGLVTRNEYVFQHQAKRVSSIADSLDAAVAFEEGGQWDDAFMQYERALALSEGGNGLPPIDRVPFVEVLSVVIDLISTQAQMNVLYANPPVETLSRFGVARTAATIGDATRANDELQVILDRLPSFAQAHFALADQYWDTGDYERGIREYGLAAQWSHDWRNLQFRFQMDRWDARIAALAKMDGLPDQLERAYLLRKRGRWEEAAILYRKLYARVPESTEAGFHVAVDDALRGEKTGAENVWKQITERAADAYPEAGAALSR